MPNRTLMCELDDTIVTPWGDYEIFVRVDRAKTGPLAGTITSAYEIFQSGRLLTAAIVPTVYPTEREAAESALRIAKLDARESLDGSFPGY